MPGFGEEVTATLRFALGEVLPVAPLLLQNLDAQTTELDAVRRRIFGVILQAIALEDLGGVNLTVVGAGHQISRGEGIPEDRQTAIPAPEVVEGGRDPVLRFAEEDSGGSLLPGRGGGCAAGAGDEQQSKQRKERCMNVLLSRRISLEMNIPFLPGASIISRRFCSR